MPPSNKFPAHVAVVVQVQRFPHGLAQIDPRAIRFAPAHVASRFGLWSRAAEDIGVIRDVPRSNIEYECPDAFPIRLIRHLDPEPQRSIGRQGDEGHMLVDDIVSRRLLAEKALTSRV